MQVYRLHNNSVLNLDWGSVTGGFCHNAFTIFLPATAQDFNQFFWGQILLLQPIQEVGGQCFLYRSGIEDGSALSLQQR